MTKKKGQTVIKQKLDLVDNINNYINLNEDDRMKKRDDKTGGPNTRKNLFC